MTRRQFRRMLGAMWLATTTAATMPVPVHAGDHGTPGQDRPQDHDGDHESDHDHDRHREGHRARDHDREGGHDLARHALERGEIRPLADVLAAARERVTGDVIEIKLERNGAAWVYEVEVIDRNGRFLELFFDARTARLLRIAGDR